MGRSRAIPATAAEEEASPAAARSKRRRVAHASEPWELASLGGGEGRRGLYHCNACQRDISGGVRIKCARCTDFDLCVECFAVGAELKPHKANHPYHVMDNLSFPLLDPDWNADEEILLLEGVEMYGLGNWTEVAEHLGGKSPERCRKHYLHAYLRSPFRPLPDLSRTRGKTKAELRAQGRRGPASPREGPSMTPVKQECESLLSIKQEEMVDEKLAERPRTPEMSATASKSLPEGENTAIGSGAKKSAAAPIGGMGEEGSEGDQQQSKRTLGGSMAKVGAILGEDPEKMGAAAIEQTGYNPKRNEFDPEYDNDAEIPLAEMEFKDTDTVADRELKIRMLEIYLSRLEERKRRKDFILERGLLNLGRLQSLDRRRSKIEKVFFQRCRVFARYLPPEEHEALLDGLNTERKLRQRIEELQELRAAGCQTFAEAEQREAEGNLGKGGQKPARHTEGGRAPGRKIGTPFDLKGHIGTGLLSPQERELCLVNRLLPVHYLKMKKTLIASGSNKGVVTRAEARQMFKIDPQKTQSVLSFLVSKSWVQSDISAPSRRRVRRKDGGLGTSGQSAPGGSGNEVTGNKGEQKMGAGEEAEEEQPSPVLVFSSGMGMRRGSTLQQTGISNGILHSYEDQLLLD